MAVDTRQKRMSMIAFGDGNHPHTTFEADSSVDLDDRQHLLDCYSGIAFASPPAAVPAGNILIVYGRATAKAYRLHEPKPVQRYGFCQRLLHSFLL